MEKGGSTILLKVDQVLLKESKGPVGLLMGQKGSWSVKMTNCF